MNPFSFVLGTRPEIIKLAPILRRVVRQGIPFQLIHTNQHYDRNMDSIFFDELQLPLPQYSLHAAASSVPLFLANVLRGLDAIWQQNHPSVVIAQGDTNTVLATALAAEKLGFPFAHVESGLRSGDRTMPEEINRILADHIATRLYVPTAHQLEHLRREGIVDGVLLTGNTIADSVHEHLPLALSTALPDTLATFPAKYAVLTLHRPSLVDDPERLRQVLQKITEIFERLHIIGIFLAHPRTRKVLETIHYSSSALFVHEPVGYLPVLRLLSSADFIITDSGGLQEESAMLKVRCMTLRATTERPETLDAGGNILIAPDDVELAEKCEQFLRRAICWKPLYESLQPSDMILADLLTHFA